MIEDEEEEEDDNGENGDDEDGDDDKDYEEEEGDDNGDSEKDDNEEITLQQEKAEQQRKKSVGKRTESDAIIAEMPKGTGQHCANVGQATEFRNYIKSVMKNFEVRVKKGKQVKKYLSEMIDDVTEACMNMWYPGMNFNPEEIVNTFLDPACKVWQAMLKGVEFVDADDLKEANERKTANIIKSDRSGKDAT